MARLDSEHCFESVSSHGRSSRVACGSLLVLSPFEAAAGLLVCEAMGEMKKGKDRSISESNRIDSGLVQWFAAATYAARHGRTVHTHNAASEENAKYAVHTVRESNQV